MDRSEQTTGYETPQYRGVETTTTSWEAPQALRQTTFFDQAKARFSETGELQLLSKQDRLRDNAGKILPCAYLIETDNTHLAAQIATELNMGIVMVGALSSATNNFPAPNPQHAFKGILAIKPKGLHSDKELQSTPAADSTPDKANQVVIDRDKMTITVGAGLTFGQVNKIIAAELGPEYFLPIDLTTVDQALAGAVFATGAMGPSRIRIHEITARVNISDGQNITSITGPEIEAREGLIGLDGAITEIELRIMERPKHRFGFSVPLQDTKDKAWTEQASKLLAGLKAATTLKLDQSHLSSDWEKGFIDGVEIITAEDLELIAQTSNSPEMRNEASRLTRELKAANSDYMLYITGNATESLTTLGDDESPNNPLNILMQLMDEETIGEATSYQGSTQLETMRQLREAIPDLAREQGRISAHTQKLRFSTSTDVNICVDANVLDQLSANELVGLFNTMLQPYYDYEEALTSLKSHAAEQGVAVQIHRYGHLQPRSMDPHTRASAEAETTNEASFFAITEAIKALKTKLNQALLALPKQDPRIQTLHGEKGKVPNKNFLTTQTLRTSQEIIEQAPYNFSFRSSL